MGMNAYNRYFFNGYNADGSMFFAVAFGIYPTRGVIDGAVSVVVDGQQHCLYASGRLGSDVSELKVGPISITINEPLREIEIVAADERLNATLSFTATSEPVEEPRFTNNDCGVGALDYTRYTQFGSWTGSISVDGETLSIDDCVGCRDRSWGQRPIGGPSGAAPQLPQFFWLWAPLNFENGSLHFDVNDYADGSRWHEAGFRAELLGPNTSAKGHRSQAAVEPMRSVEYELTLQSGSRWVQQAKLILNPWNGSPLEVELTPLVRFQMKGLGYGHPEHRHGAWQGEQTVDFETIALADVDPASQPNFHVQHLVTARLGDQVGVGVLEILAIGDHEPTGLTGLVDVKS